MVLMLESRCRWRLLDLRGEDKDAASEADDTDSLASSCWNSCFSGLLSSVLLKKGDRSIAESESTGSAHRTLDLFLRRNGNGAGMWILAKEHSKGQLHPVSPPEDDFSRRPSFRFTHLKKRALRFGQHLSIAIVSFLQKVGENARK